MVLSDFSTKNKILIKGLSQKCFRLSVRAYPIAYRVGNIKVPVEINLSSDGYRTPTDMTFV